MILDSRHLKRKYRAYCPPHLLGSVVSGRSPARFILGATVLFYPTAIGWHPDEKRRHGGAQRGRVENSSTRTRNCERRLCCCRQPHRTRKSRTPQSAGIQFWGSSFIADPQGVILAEASTDKEEILIADVDLAHLEDIRRNWPFLRDRRIDAYCGVTSRYLAKETWKS